MNKRKGKSKRKKNIPRCKNIQIISIPVERSPKATFKLDVKAFPIHRFILKLFVDKQ